MDMLIIASEKDEKTAIKKAEEASKKLEDLDKNAGMKVPSKKEVDDTKIEMDWGLDRSVDSALVCWVFT